MSLKRLAFPLAASALALAFAGLSAAACGDDSFTIPPPPDAAVDARVDTGTLTPSDGGPSTTDDGGTTPPNKHVNGTACAGATECASGYCTDGVCCESACTGTCESCNVAGSAGTCAAVPANTDPDTECGADPTVGGGNDFDGGYDASASTPTPSQCAGRCDGNRACTFAPSGTSCGNTFCGNPSEEGVAQCDGKGHCLIEAQECSAYACPGGNGGCKTTCKSSADCAKGFTCDVASSTCKPKSIDGTACTAAEQCASNACTTFYRDIDGDTHGTPKVTMQICGTTAPTGFVTSNDDCWDSQVALAASVHPGQTAYFDKAYNMGNGAAASFDYDCSGTVDKETADDATCGFCDRGVIQQQIAIPPIGLSCHFDATCTTADQAPAHACTGPTNCTADNTDAFAATVACGATSTTMTCSSCKDAAGTSTPIPGNDKTQRCH